MNPELKSLYRETLLKHSRSPHNRGVLGNADTSCQLKNPLCGDVVTIYLTISGQRISQANFEAQCCSICMASASMLSERVTESDLERSLALAESLITSLTERKSALALPDNSDLHALTGVRSFPSRIRCATLPWEAFRKAVAKVS